MYRNWVELRAQRSLSEFIGFSNECFRQWTPFNATLKGPTQFGRNCSHYPRVRIKWGYFTWGGMAMGPGFLFAISGALSLVRINRGRIMRCPLYSLELIELEYAVPYRRWCPVVADTGPRTRRGPAAGPQHIKSKAFKLFPSFWHQKSKIFAVIRVLSKFGACPCPSSPTSYFLAHS